MTKLSVLFAELRSKAQAFLKLFLAGEILDYPGIADEGRVEQMMTAYHELKDATYAFYDIVVNDTPVEADVTFDVRPALAEVLELQEKLESMSLDIDMLGHFVEVADSTTNLEELYSAKDATRLALFRILGLTWQPS